MALVSYRSTVYHLRGCRVTDTFQRRAARLVTTSNTCTPPYSTARDHIEKVAISDQHGQHSYADLLRRSLALAKSLKLVTGTNLQGERVVYLTDNDSSNVIIKWASWLNNSIAVPLCATHPTAEKQYFVDDSGAQLIIGTEKYGQEISQLASKSRMKKLVLSDNMRDWDMASSVDEGSLKRDVMDKALIIYTSGTTGRPKGVVVTHGNIQATTEDMVSAWEWLSSDVCLNTLPLHHIHGLINSLHVPLSVGAQCIMLPKFDAKTVWSHFLDSPITVFTAVPTIYAKLLQYYEEGKDPRLTEDVIKAAFKRIRLTMSGSSALPIAVINSWYNLTGHKLLERYGMSEVLMALTHPMHGPRHSGTVGRPFPSVKALIAKEDPLAVHGYTDVSQNASKSNPGCSEEGELYIKGPTVFTEYWKKPEATKEAFTPDGWFKTGDTVCVDKDGYFRILGRTSVDIIKSGGFKISALDIENKLLHHPDVAECAVLGKADPVYGQVVAVLVVLKAPESVTEAGILDWCRDKMPKYHIPKSVKFVKSIPKNAMGKINKKSLLHLL